MRPEIRPFDLGVIEWRATNLEASGAWTRLGFRPTFLRLDRAIV